MELKKSLAEVLEARGEPMIGADSPWCRHLLDIPADSAAPLAMSPRHPRAIGSYGAEVLAWAARELRFTPRWWQALAIQRQFEHDKSGALVWREVIESGPRRIGKSVRLRVAALWRTDSADLLGGGQTSMLVSKDLAIGKEIHSRAWPWAEAQGWRVDRTGGSQSIEKSPTDRWLLRSEHGVYGYDVDYGQVDEAWGVDPAAITEGLAPALIERPSAQLHLTSTAHVKATSLLRTRLANALSGMSDDTLLMLWGPKPGIDLDDPGTWRAASPYWSADREQLVAAAWRAAKEGTPQADDPDPLRGWAAQYLNVWPLLLESGGSKILPKWAELSAPVRVGRAVGLGVACDPHATWLAFAAVIDGEPLHVGLSARLPVSKRPEFIRIVADAQAKHGTPVVIDKGGPAAFLIPELERAGVGLEPIGTDRLVQAVADFVQAVDSGDLEHGGYPELDAATVAADWRMIGDRRVFARRSGDISALEAACLAHHGAVSVEAWSGIL